MNRLRRALLILAVSLAVTTIAVVIRSLNATGVFTEVKPDFAGTCSTLGGVVGAADMAVDRGDRLVFVSATDRRALSGPTNRQDGLYAIALDRPARGLIRLAGTPSDFHPQGIGLYRAADGVLTLMAVNRRAAGGSAIEIFAVSIADGAAKLTQTGTIESDALVGAAGIAAVGPDRFYVTNDHGSKTEFGRMLEDYLLLPRANVLYFDGNVFHVAADNLNGASGTRIAPDGSHLYVATTTGRTLYAYERNAFTGALRETGELSIPSGLDNVEFDAGGNLWVAGHPSLIDLWRYETDSARRSPSQVFKVTMAEGVPVTATAIYTNAGDQIAAAGVGVVAGHDLFIGSRFDSRVLDCRLP